MAEDAQKPDWNKIFGYAIPVLGIILGLIGIGFAAGLIG